METPTTENPYPVQARWLLKNILGILIYIPIIIIAELLIARFNGIDLSFDGVFGPFIFSTFVSIFLLILVLRALIPLAVSAFKRSNFHYSLGDKFMTIHQGGIKKEQRNVPYGVIQGVFFHQDMYDRILGLASVTIEDFSNRGKSAANIDGDILVINKGHRYKIEIIGFLGNKIHIPGLKKEHAEALKATILQKMKENPLEDSQSGL